MIRPRPLLAAVAVLGIAGVVLTGAPATGQAPRTGGVLTVAQREDTPQGFAIHETSTISTVWPAMPCFSNLVLYDPLKKQESEDTIIGELAEKWAWQDNARTLVFTLRKGVTWHDGQPFTSRDVKHTFDLLRESPDATAKLRINPRNDWYANVEAVETPDPHTVVLRLKRPQPSLLAMLASGYTPIYAAHIPPAQYRTSCVGTGPFKLKEWRKGEFIEYVKNPTYFIKGRPYLDGIRYVVIKERGTRVAALQAGQVDAAFPGDTSKTTAEQLKKAVPQMVITPSAENVNENVIMNTKKPPFDNVKVRLAVSHAIDRRALNQAVHQGGAVVGSAMLGKPYGVWGLLDKDLAAQPGYGKPSEEKAKARKLMAEMGYTSDKPLRVEIVTRAIAIYVDMASFIINELKQVGIEATLRQIETAQWHAMATRGDYQIGANLTGIGADDPDANFYENFGCDSPRNYTFYCNEQIASLIDKQSAETDRKKRLALVWDIQKRLEAEAARPMLVWRVDNYAHWPHVKNLIPHQVFYNYGRMQEVWLDK
ncbi:MAG TPA: ABC transporter substrate-binding protein [Candidatus Tectomicrobia bacterium]|nr:ABC transporter substrate-binding protein [Candidatus Tectomicrobia bacterium]